MAIQGITIGLSANFPVETRKQWNNTLKSWEKKKTMNKELYNQQKHLLDWEQTNGIFI